MSNSNLAGINCNRINFSGCVFGLREPGAIESQSLTKFGKQMQNCDMRGCSFHNVKVSGEWNMVII
jgi:uncharacterized protein YjbI with pentapeptide repeats